MVKFYWSSELLQFGDQVQFRIATRSFDNLVYALDILVEQTAKEIRFRVRETGKYTGGGGGILWEGEGGWDLNFLKLNVSGSIGHI